jgi:hypothetical protein
VLIERSDYATSNELYVINVKATKKRNEILTTHPQITSFNNISTTICST